LQPSSQMKTPVDSLEEPSLRPWDYDANETKPGTAKATTDKADAIPPDGQAEFGARSLDDGLSDPTHELGH